MLLLFRSSTHRYLSQSIIPQLSALGRYLLNFPQASVTLEDFWLKGTGEFANDTLVRVSYTHLDVYKRQDGNATHPLRQLLRYSNDRPAPIPIHRSNQIGRAHV